MYNQPTTIHMYVSWFLLKKAKDYVEISSPEYRGFLSLLKWLAWSVSYPTTRSNVDQDVDAAV